MSLAHVAVLAFVGLASATSRYGVCLTDADCATVPGDKCLSAGDGLTRCFNPMIEGVCGAQTPDAANNDLTDGWRNSASADGICPCTGTEDVGGSECCGVGACDLGHLQRRVISRTDVAANSNEANKASFEYGVAPLQIYDKRRWQCKNPEGTLGYSCPTGMPEDRYALLNHMAAVSSAAMVKGRASCSMSTETVRDPENAAEWPVTGPGNQRCHAQTVGGEEVEYSCCVRTKFFHEFSSTTSGNCYNPKTEGCCDTGDVYTLGQSQCCALDGIKGVDEPCSCGADSDCHDPSLAVLQGSAADLGAAMMCCSPPVANMKQEYPQCNKYFSRVVGAATDPPMAASASQFCPGKCIHPETQHCCAGTACHSEFETCCGDQCCNDRDERCIVGYKHDRFGFLSSIWAHASPNADRNIVLKTGERIQHRFPLPNTRATDRAWNDGTLRGGAAPEPFSVIHTADQMGEQQYYCSRIEDISWRGAFAIGYQPFFLIVAVGLLATLSITAITDRSTRPFSLIEKGLLFTSGTTAVLSALTFFSPHWKFGFTVCVISILSMLAFISQIKRAIFFGWLAQVLLILFIANPFAGNAIGSFNWEQNTAVAPNHGYNPSSLDQATDGANLMRHEPNGADFIQDQGILGHFRNDGEGGHVTQFYDGYGEWDPLTRDNRFQNQEERFFGFASRLYNFWSLVVVVFVIMAVWVGFVLATMVVFLNVYRAEQVSQLTEELEDELLDPLKEREGNRTRNGLTFREADGTYVVANE